MKRCPTCNRTFTDETLSFCLDDGSPLLDAAGVGPQSQGSGPFIKPPQSMGSPASAAPTVAYSGPPQPASQAAPGWQGSPPQQQQPQRKRKVWPWALGIVGVLFVLGIGFILLIIALAAAGSNTNTSNSSANNSNARAVNRNGSASNANAGNASDVGSANNSSSANNSNFRGGLGNGTSNASNSNAAARSASDVQITEISMARDNGKGGFGEAVDTFGPSERTIYCVISLNKPSTGTKIKFSWYIVDAGGLENSLLKEIDYTTGAEENVVHAHLTAPNDWPTGDYRVDVSVNGGPTRSIDYSVE